MGYPTDIEWTDATSNPVGGCSIKSPGCIHCYAQQLAGTRLRDHPMYAGTTNIGSNGKPVFNGKLTIAADDHDVWKWPLRWRGSQRPKMGPGKPSMIFVADMSDLFHENRPSAQIIKVTTTFAQCSHIAQFLTKRPDVMEYHFNHVERIEPQRNFWLGFSAERQREFDERWPYMRRLANKGWTIYVSIEPMIGPVVLPEDFLDFGNRIQVICGGESGDDRRLSETIWFRAVRDQCLPVGVAFFMKQMTGKKAIPNDLMIRQFPATALDDIRQSQLSLL